MHRRDFLKLLLASPLAAQIDYEQLLWIPGEKKIFIPSIHTIDWNEINLILIQTYKERVREMFERDNAFYTRLIKHGHR